MITRLKHLIGSERLTGRLFRGGAVLGMGSGAEYGLRFIRNMILARLLAPEAFGLMAIILSVSSLFQVLTGLGIMESIVQNPRGAEKPYLNGAWWLAAGRGLILYMAVFIAAPWVAGFYNAPELKTLLRVAFVCVVAQGALSSAAYVAMKQMRYGRWALIQNGGSAIGIVTTVVLAFHFKGVWALVLGYATEGIARCALSYIICPFLPGFHFEREHWNELIRFAKGILGLPLLVLIYAEGSIFTVGKICTKGELGIFAMALALAKLPRMASGILGELFVPAFSKLQRDPASINKALYKVTTIATLLMLPLFCFVLAYGREILEVAFGSKYASGYLLLIFLFANEVVFLCNVPLASVFVGVGQPALLRRAALIRALLVLVLIVPATLIWGAPGGAIVPFVAVAVAYLFQLLQVKKLTALNLANFPAILLRSALFALPVAAVWFFGNWLPGLTSPVGNLIAHLALCSLLYAIGGLIFCQNKVLRLFFWPSFQEEARQ